MTQVKVERMGGKQTATTKEFYSQQSAVSKLIAVWNLHGGKPQVTRARMSKALLSKREEFTWPGYLQRSLFLKTQRSSHYLLGGSVIVGKHFIGVAAAVQI